MRKASPLQEQTAKVKHIINKVLAELYKFIMC